MSFGAQALHYFQRPHEAVCRSPIGGAVAWHGAGMRRRDDWVASFTPAQVDELAAAVAGVRRRDLAMGDVRRADVPLPSLAGPIAAWRDQLRDGRGFVLLRGLPVAEWGDDDSALAYWILGQHLGRPGAQNPAGELLGHVVDTGEDAANPFVRRYRTAGDIAWHCDLADVVGLLCLRQAPRGGASRIVSSVAVYDELLRRRPDLVERLYEPIALDSRDEQSSGGPAWYPVPPCRFADGRLRTFYHSDYFRSAERHADAPRFDHELLDLYEAIAGEPELYLDMELAPGDVQLLSNHTILHARTAYEDDPQLPRHLLRLWLSLE